MPSVPTPAAARYSAAGEPIPPAPSEAPAFQQLQLARLATPAMTSGAEYAPGHPRLTSRYLERQAFVLPAVEPASQLTHVAVAHTPQVVWRRTDLRRCAGAPRVRSRSGTIPQSSAPGNCIQPWRRRPGLPGDFRRIAHVDQAGPASVAVQRFARADSSTLPRIRQAGGPCRPATRHRRQIERTSPSLTGVSMPVRVRTLSLPDRCSRTRAGCRPLMTRSRRSGWSAGYSRFITPHTGAIRRRFRFAPAKPRAACGRMRRVTLLMPATCSSNEAGAVDRQEPQVLHARAAHRNK